MAVDGCELIMVALDDVIFVIFFSLCNNTVYAPEFFLCVMVWIIVVSRFFFNLSNEDLFTFKQNEIHIKTNIKVQSWQSYDKHKQVVSRYTLYNFKVKS